jgi:hypothetical protein
MNPNNNREVYNIISFLCFAVVVTPIIIVLYWGADVQIKDKHPGMVKVEPGKLFVKKKDVAEGNPLNQSLILAERLNAHIASLVLESPGSAIKIRQSKAGEIAKTIESLSDNPPLNLLSRAQSRSLKWAPKAGLYGLFILDLERYPSSTPSFGLVELPGGKELSTYKTEKEMNEILHKLRKTPSYQQGNLTITPQSLLSDAIRTRPPLLKSTRAVELIGLCYGLNINYNEDLGLFLARETVQQIIPWQRELKN